MLKLTFCPTFTILSFIFFITMIDIIMYILTLIFTFAYGDSLSYYAFLGPSCEVLDDFGDKYPYKI